ncbi:MAG: outer membrane beta-barrel protein [Candidatus Pedobacter colombiensis]|uniref:Outer membrane beta-barrel protein n=1 Tax=Candidatus Pedobacter colombiensis TaxID=3121371 RepID=A0AAJ5W3Z9_9SPHI|nr:outer membrane beta-barrel protein [Pedobacter sp.]WEK18098.1 MAG: outer membrane beta-barrel protein [Pedobacter sp.]
MKKKLLLALTFVTSIVISANAQNYKKVKVDIGLGYAIPKGGESGGTKAGATFTVEPHYRLSDALSVGVRFEGAGLGHLTNPGTNDEKVKVSVLTSYCATGEYYFSNTGFRPFAGAGLGFYKSSSVDIDSSTGSNFTTIPGASEFGFFPRAGFETGHFRMSAEYNIIGGNAGYFAAKIGFFFGGGKK